MPSRGPRRRALAIRLDCFGVPPGGVQRNDSGGRRLLPKRKTVVENFATPETFVHLTADHPGEFAEAGVESGGDELPDQSRACADRPPPSRRPRRR